MGFVKLVDKFGFVIKFIKRGRNWWGGWGWGSSVVWNVGGVVFCVVCVCVRCGWWVCGVCVCCMWVMYVWFVFVVYVWCVFVLCGVCFVCMCVVFIGCGVCMYLIVIIEFLLIWVRCWEFFTLFRFIFIFVFWGR